MSPLQATSSATKWPAHLMKQEATPGNIDPGQLADVIVVKGYVLEGIGNLRNVVQVIKAGQVYK